MIDKLALDPKFLQKFKDAALEHKLDPIPKGLEDHWAAIMWIKGAEMVLNYYGYKIVKND